MGQTGRSDVTAAFLYHFTQFVDWPPLKAGDAFTICIAGDQATTISVRSFTRDKFVGSHPVRVLLVEGPPETRGCQLLFLAACPTPRLQQYLTAVRDSGMLIVGEQPEVLELGGMVELFVQRQRIAFSINNDAMQRAHLHVSSKVLRLAREAEESSIPGGGH